MLLGSTHYFGGQSQKRLKNKCARRGLRVPCTAHRTTEAIWNDLPEPKQLVVDVAISKL